MSSPERTSGSVGLESKFNAYIAFPTHLRSSNKGIQSPLLVTSEVSRSGGYDLSFIAKLVLFILIFLSAEKKNPNVL